MDLKTIISERGLKQGWIARQIGLTDNQFSRIVLGLSPVHPSLVGPLAKTLSITRAELVRAINGNGAA